MKTPNGQSAEGWRAAAESDKFQISGELLYERGMRSEKGQQTIEVSVVEVENAL